MASSRGFLNIQSLNELTSENVPPYDGTSSLVATGRYGRIPDPWSYET